MGWEKIESMFSEKYVEDRRTEENGYKDNMWCIIEDLGELFSHGSDYIHSNFEIEEQI